MYLLVLSESISAELIELMVHWQAYDDDDDDDLPVPVRSRHLRRVVDEMADTGWIVNSTVTYLILTRKW